MRRVLLACIGACAAMSGSANDLTQASFAEHQAAMSAGAATAESITQAYLGRIQAVDRTGPRLNSVISINPRALTIARALDDERRAGQLRGGLQGLPILIKDNIETADPMATTAGSLALKDNVTNRDSPLVRRLRGAGAVILGKANLSEWANMRSTRSINGWSAVGGLVRNPYALDRGPCGSSSGSAVAVSAGLAAASIGTETDGSITCPASAAGIVGLKPTVGLISRTHIVPITSSQDTAGPMTRTVTDAAALLTVMAGSDPLDAATRDADEHKRDYVAALDAAALKGSRLGVLRLPKGISPGTDALFESTLNVLQRAGATVVEVAAPDLAAMDAAEEIIFNTEFKSGIDAYLRSTPPVVASRTLQALIAFNRNEPRELALFGQEVFEAALTAPSLTDRVYLDARQNALRLSRDEGIDRMLRVVNVEALVAPGPVPPPVVDTLYPRRSTGSPSALPAVAGYPHLTVPMGEVHGLPVGLSFIGPAWSEARLLALGYAFEQISRARRPPALVPSIDRAPPISSALDP